MQPVLAAEGATKQDERLLIVRLLVIKGHGEEVWLAMDAVQHVTQGAAHLTFSLNEVIFWWEPYHNHGPRPGHAGF